MHEIDLQAYRIDAQVVRWAEYLPLVEAGGAAVPRYLRQVSGRWQQCRGGQWQTLDLTQPACHLSAQEAEAWCAWAGPAPADRGRMGARRRHAARGVRLGRRVGMDRQPLRALSRLRLAHPYRDYSAPWFGSRRVLRGASFGTQPRLHHPR